MTYAEKQAEAVRRIRLRIENFDMLMVKAMQTVGTLDMIASTIESHVVRVPEHMLDRVLALYNEEGEGATDEG